MTIFGIIILTLAYVIAGMIVVESARIWFGMWWLTVRFSTILFWPLIALAALFGKNHES